MSPKCRNFRRRSFVVGMLILPALMTLAGARPQTVQELFLELGEKPGELKQLKLKFESEASGDEMPGFPKKTSSELIYDRGRRLVLLVSESVFADGSTGRATTFASEKRGVIWTDRWPKGVSQEEPPERMVQPYKPSEILPNPWRLPVRLGMPALFADAIHGYQALAREYAISRVVKGEDGDEGMKRFDMRASTAASRGLRAEFNKGLKVKAGFESPEGWLKELEIVYPGAKSSMRMWVTDRELELDTFDLSRLKIPKEIEDWKAPEKTDVREKPGVETKSEETGK